MPPDVRLLGIAAIQSEDAWIEPSANRVSALLYYLAYQNKWVSRNELAFLFWPDIPEATARSNLRKVLARARALTFATHLETERSRLRWQVDSDLGAFKQALAKDQIHEAMQLYKGDLLQDFYIDGLIEFETWLETEREELKRMFQKLVLSNVNQLETKGHFADAVRF